MMKKKILLPTDFSKSAWNAIIFAIELYKNETCDFYIFNTFHSTGYALDSMMFPEPGEKTYEAAKLQSDKGLLKTMEHLKIMAANPNHNFFVVSEFNNLLDGINAMVEKHDISVIIMGTKGATDSSEVVYGSNTTLVMEKSRSCPVMAIPNDTNYKLKEIVFPTNYKTNFKLRELQNLIDIVQLSNATLCVLYISDGKNLSEDQIDNKKLLVECFNDIDLTFHTLHNINVNDGVRCFVESRDSDMITFYNRKHSLFESLFSKPMIKDLGYHASVPVLALHESVQ